ncbi:Do/DeqQ family serine protease [Roseovarius halotolerans]|uniref:Periplasmic pH-dependent serine endoprotease DegQ n=1 Tax=Roseovarius halotolerans TaxID=505353 RepID=A0A1X6ZJT6_9RHOB|nr:trypsin-like peptidase domain-containing protein [Roseovarius halotolerans]RKT31048.1 Do/DeqQ family serine protease [Roseovarius halotolerans]SLN53111.1 Periplasmic pH-dependent serine endoprotease DegQ precursor [Roseovarius halotolerans]
MIRALCILGLVLSGPAWADDPRVPQSPAEISLSFTPVVKRAAPAVVNIYARRIINTRSSPFSDDPFFQNLFRDFGVPRQRVQNSLGSGVILSEDGIVVSNYHVVAEATDIRVVLNDRREYSASVLLADQESDLAVLRLEDAPEMPALDLRDSDSVEVGELVLAIGNPFGVGQTVSSGIVSGLARSGTATGNARGYFIQTDAPINPGNSGGALVDIDGRLIGVNTAILSRSGGSNGIGFAIPSALVAQFLEQAKAGNTSFERPWAGLAGQQVTADMVEGLGLSRPGGLIISQVHPQSGFASDIRPGDVITTVDGEPVNTPAEMLFRMSVAGIGTNITVTRVRDGEVQDVTLALAAAPDTPARAPTVTPDRAAIPGVTISTINPAVLAEYDLPLGATGVLVEDPGQIGARAGLRAGDILRSIDGVEITDTSEAEALLLNARGQLAIEVQRGTQRVVMRFRL